jgi:hypothetical protein
MPQNPQRRTATIFWVLSAFFVLAIFAPSVFGVGVANGGFAISLLAGLAALVSLVAALIYRNRALALDSILAGKDLLAHWKYAPADKPGEVFIARDGIYLNGQLHMFSRLGARLERASYNEEEKFLSFTYSGPSRGGRYEYIVKVPVPTGQEDEARRVIASFQNAQAGT